MLMTAALHLHMDSAVHGHGPSPSSSSTSPRSPWLADDNYRQHQLIPCDFPASAPSPPTPATAAPPSNHQHLRPASRRVAKRRPRPSRKLPTTYITADPASFRRMVHQVTGADDLPPIISPPPAPEETLCRPAPYRASTTGGAMLLPTLDTSAFLLGAGSAAPALVDQQVEVAAAGDGGACNYNGNSCGSSFPTLDSSWDDPLF